MCPKTTLFETDYLLLGQSSYEEVFRKLLNWFLHIVCDSDFGWNLDRPQNDDVATTAMAHG